MKMNMKLAAIMLAATSIFAVTGCDSNGSGEETKTDETVEIKIGSITVTENSATVTGTLKVGKDVPSGTAIGIEYSTNEAFPVNDRTKAKVNADSEGKYSIEIKNLESDKDYFVRTYVCKDGKNYEYGTPQKFHTNKASTGGGEQGGDDKPGENNVVVNIEKIEGYVSEILITVKVIENPAGAKFGLQISSDADFDAQYTAETAFTPDETLKTTLRVKNLSVGATYYAKAYCILNNKTNWSQASSFTVHSDPISSSEGISDPYVQIYEETGRLWGPSGRIGAIITWPSSNRTEYQFGVQISNSENFEYLTFEGTYNENDIDLEGRYSVRYVTCLLPSTVYYIRNYMKKGEAYTYSNVVSKKTEDIELLTKTEEITSKSGKIIVNVDWNWTALITNKDFKDDIKFGIEISKESEFSEIVTEETNLTMVNSTSSYSATYTIPEILTAKTKYYYRVFYTVNSGERIYQATVGSFTTTE